LQVDAEATAALKDRDMYHPSDLSKERISYTITIRVNVTCGLVRRQAIWALFNRGFCNCQDLKVLFW